MLPWLQKKSHVTVSVNVKEVFNFHRSIYIRGVRTERTFLSRECPPDLSTDTEQCLLHPTVRNTAKIPVRLISRAVRHCRKTKGIQIRKEGKSWAWWRMPLIPALGRQRQADL